MTLLGLNMIVTIVTMRVPGITWGKLPLLLGRPQPLGPDGPCRSGADRGAADGCARPWRPDLYFLASAGGSPYLFQNLFWFFGHPEVFVLALPGMGIILELFRSSRGSPYGATGWPSPACWG